MDNIETELIIAKIDSMLQANKTEVAERQKEIAESQRNQIKWIIGFVGGSITVGFAALGIYLKFLIDLSIRQ